MTREEEINSYAYKLAKASVDYSQKHATGDELQGIVTDKVADALDKYLDDINKDKED